MTVTTTHHVDEIKLRRYAFSELSTQPSHKKVTDTKHELIFGSPTSVIGLHSIATYRDDTKVHKEIANLDIDLLIRYVDVRSREAAQVVVRQQASAPVATLNRAIVTAPE
jgi:hypothetical protein